MSRRLGALEILGELSAGGMGEVLLAKRVGAHGFEKLVAVKTIRPELAERDDMRTLFLDEARLVALIEHPAVAQVHDFGEDQGTLYLAMEYVQGVSLDVLLDRVGRLPPEIAVRIAERICRGLHAAHETRGADGALLGVVHRDVSPPNVMLSFDGGVKILDFGIALKRDRRAPHTQVGRRRGKLAYMAPEQLRGGAVDRRTDVWGVANLLFELLTGRRLRGELELAQVGEALERAAPPPSSLAPVPAALDAIVLQGLALRAEDRYPDARSFALALDGAQRALGGESLEDYAQRALVEDQHAQRKQIAALGLTPPAAELTPRRGPTLVASGATPPPQIQRTVVPAAPRPRRRWALALALPAGALLALAMRGTGEPPPPEKSSAPSEPAVEIAPERAAGAGLAEVVLPAEEETRAPPELPRAARPRRAIAHKPSPAAPRGHGTLTIGAHPYAVVLIDGREQGLTPLVDLSLEAGTHELRYLDPATRALRAEQVIEVPAGGHVSRVLR